MKATKTIDLTKLASVGKDLVESMAHELEGAHEETRSDSRWPARFISAATKLAPPRWGNRFAAFGPKSAPSRD